MKKSISLLLLIALLLSLSCSGCGCSRKKEKFSAYSFDYFDTVTIITGYETDKETFDDVSDSVMEQLEDYHTLYSIYNSFEGVNNLCALNQLVDGVHPCLEVDPRILDMLEFALDMYELSGGRVNVAMGSVLSIWHKYRTFGMASPEDASLPSMEQLQDAAKHTSPESLVIDREKGTVWISDPEMTLDVGAIAKGYAVEMIAQSLEEQGITGYVLNVGGNVRTIGLRGDGTPWAVGIEDPDDPEGYREILDLSDASLVTSGSYQRYYVVDGKNYHHIIDPDTLMPAAYYVSVSIVCRSSALADGLSTALFSMPVEEGMALIDSLEEVEAMWVPVEGDIVYSEGFRAFCR